MLPLYVLRYFKTLFLAQLCLTCCPRWPWGTAAQSAQPQWQPQHFCHRTDHHRKYLFLLHRTLESNCFKDQRSQYPEPHHHHSVTATVTEGKCCLHRASIWDRKIASEWSAKTQSYIRAKPKQLENWGVLETLWAEPEESQQLQHHSLLSRIQEAATAVLYGMEDLLQSHPGKGLGCV